MSLLRVAVLDDYQHVAADSTDWSPLAGLVSVEIHHDPAATREELVQRIAGADAVIAMRERTAFPAEVLARLPRLRLLVTTGMVNAAIDLDAARLRGVTVCGTQGGGAAAAAEMAFGLTLSLLRRIPQENAAVRGGRWQVGIGRELAGTTLGLLGLGHLGQRMARYAAAFDMPTLAWSANLTSEAAAEHGVTRVEKDELFARSDVVSIHTLLSRRTRGLVGDHELDLLGARGYLVNTSRGPIVQEAALLRALREGTIAGAGLDVFDVEPLPPFHPLRTAPNVVITPHTGYVTEQTYAAWFTQAVDDIARWIAGDPVRVLNP